MALPFTTEQFLDVFRQYNTAIWPAQIALTAAAGATVWSAGRGRSRRLVPLYLAGQWTWTGVVYHWLFFTRINPAARAFAVLWLAGALAFAVSAFKPPTLSFRTSKRARLAVGLTLIVYALVVYPILGHLDGRAYPSAPTYGAPCPVAILTLGLLWLARSPIPRFVFVAPILWAALAIVAAISLGVREDLGLAVAGLSGLVLLGRELWLGRVRRSERSEGVPAAR